MAYCPNCDEYFDEDNETQPCCSCGNTDTSYKDKDDFIISNNSEYFEENTTHESNSENSEENTNNENDFYEENLNISEEKFNKAYDLFKNGNDLYSNNKYFEAIAEYSKAIEIYPAYPEALYYRGTVYIELEKYYEAINDFNVCLSNDYLIPKFNLELSGIYLNRGYAYLKICEFEKAIEDYKETFNVSNDIENSKLFLIQGILLHKLGKYDEAIANFSRAIRLQPFFYDAYLNRSLAYFEKNEYIKAKNDFEKVMEVFADNHLQYKPLNLGNDTI